MGWVKPLGYPTQGLAGRVWAGFLSLLDGLGCGSPTQLVMGWVGFGLEPISLGWVGLEGLGLGQFKSPRDQPNPKPKGLAQGKLPK